MNRDEHERRALYLYCVGHADELALLSESGSDQRFPAYALRRERLAAVVSEVSLADFTGVEAERRLENLEWMGERALRHERVVEAALARGPVLPVRFGTLFSDIEVLRRFLEINREAIVDFLEMARGHEEWGVKAFLDRSAAAKWIAASALSGTSKEAPASPGLHYLRERRAQAAAQGELHRWVADSCAAAVESLRRLATEWRERKVIDSGEPDGLLEPVLNAAVLLERGRVQELMDGIEALNAERQHQGLILIANGPWPPYSFCPRLETPR